MQVRICPPRSAGFLGSLLAFAILAEGILGQPMAVAQAEEVQTADREMAAALAARDETKFRSFLLPDVRFLGSGTLEKGPDQVMRAWAHYFDPESGKILRWQPQEATVAASQDMAFTVGSFQVIQTTAGKEQTIFEGRYVTVWRRQKEGWRVAADGNLTPTQPAGLELKLEMHQKPPRAILQGSASMAARAVRVYTSDAEDMAFAVGDYRAPDPEGGRQAQQGVFLAILQKNANGAWNLVASSFPPPR